MSGDDRMLEQYISGMAKGDKDALALFYEKTRTAVYAYACSILQNQQDAEDVSQQTYLRIWSAASTYKPKGKPMAWVTVTVRNLSLDLLRRRQKITPLSEEDWNSLPSPEKADSGEDRITLQIVLKKLEDEERQILVLHAVAGFKHREIAEHLNRPLSTVLSKYHRALNKLRAAWEEEKIHA